MGARHNPFSTCHFHPGVIPWVGDLEALYHRFLELGGQAQVVGPCGTGKSTLLAHLGRRARRDGVRVQLFDDATLVAPWRVRWARWRHPRLLVAAHHDLGLPTLCSRHVPVTTARAVVAHLLTHWEIAPPSDEELCRLLQAHDGNLRHALFELYDQFEASLEAHAG